jgi:hypothetical protein
MTIQRVHYINSPKTPKRPGCKRWVREHFTVAYQPQLRQTPSTSTDGIDETPRRQPYSHPGASFAIALVAAGSSPFTAASATEEARVSAETSLGRMIPFARRPGVERASGWATPESSRRVSWGGGGRG